jgi:hypothetical protein
MFLEPGVILVTVDPVDYRGVFPKGKRGKFAKLMERGGRRKKVGSAIA